VRGDLDQNVAEHIRLSELAALEGAQLVVFPELSLTGYEIDLADRMALSENDRRLELLVEVAGSRSLTLIVGAPVRLGPRLHIGAFVLYPDGTSALYTKHRLGAFGESARCDGIVPPAEATAFEPGDRSPLVRWGDASAAVAICADIGAPSHAENAAARGAAAYLASMFVIPSDFQREAARLSGYAAEHAMVVALANFGGASGGLAAAGRSSIWSQSGELIAQLASNGSGVAVGIETADGWHSKTIMLGGVHPTHPRPRQSPTPPGQASQT
jgi:predicted amidohydrolase